MSIDDWYLSSTQRRGANPNFGPDDDVPDPFVLGEAPQREWTVRGSRRKARPARPVAEVSQASKAKNQAGRSARSSSGHRRRAPAAKEPWRTFAARWLQTHPNASNRHWREAVEEAGYVGVTAAAISALRKEIKPVRGKPRRQPVARPAPSPAPAVKIDYCDGCGIAVGDNGLCRC